MSARRSWGAIAAFFKVHRTTVYQVAQRFRHQGEAGLWDRRAHNSPKKLTADFLEALDRLMVGRTTFMIAHRLSTIHKAGLMLVVDHGRLVEQGTHGQLMSENGRYAALWRAQTDAKEATQELHTPVAPVHARNGNGKVTLKGASHA